MTVIGVRSAFKDIGLRPRDPLCKARKGNTQPMPMGEYKAANLAMWDETVDIHYGSDFYGVERFKAGETTLEDLERPEMGASMANPCCTCSTTSAWTRFHGRGRARP